MYRTNQTVAALAVAATLGLFSSAAQSALSQYSFSASIGQVSAPMAGFTPQAGDTLQGTFSYLGSDTLLGSATQVTIGRYSTRYVYQMPSDARIDFTLGGHNFSSDKVSLMVSQSDWVEAGADMVAVIGQNLTMDGVALPTALVDFEFVYPVGTFANGLPPQTLQLNAPVVSHPGFAWTGTGYIVENGGVSLSTSVAGPGSVDLTFKPQTLAAVPEPGTWALMLLGLGGVMAERYRKRT